MRSRYFAWLLMALAGCGPEFAVVPRDGAPRITSTVGPISITAYAQEWDGEPSDLPDYMTPVAVELYNAGPYEVRVAYSDFALRDSSGFRYGAINPFLPGEQMAANAAKRPLTMPMAQPLDAAGDDALADNDMPAGNIALRGGVLVAALDAPFLMARGGGGGGGGGGHGGGGGGGGGHYGGGGGGGGHAFVGSYQYGGRYHLSGAPLAAHRWGNWTGFHFYGGLRRYYGGYGTYWGGPFYYPPYYWNWVNWWGPSYYPSGPTEDVVGYALPEGVLQPGGRVSGFLYFKKATAEGRALDLAWSAYDARSRGYLGTVEVALKTVDK